MFCLDLCRVCTYPSVTYRDRDASVVHRDVGHSKAFEIGEAICAPCFRLCYNKKKSLRHQGQPVLLVAVPPLEIPSPHENLAMASSIKMYLFLAFLCLECGVLYAQSSPVFLQWAPGTLNPVSPTCRASHTVVNMSLTIAPSSPANSSCSALILFGGFNFLVQANLGSGPLIFYNDLWIFMGSLQTWMRFNDNAANNPSARAGHIAVSPSFEAHSFSMAMHGGTNSITVFGDVWVFHFSIHECPPFLVLDAQGTTSKGAWRMLTVSSPSAPLPRWGHMGGLINNSLVVFGGFSSPLGKMAMWYGDAEVCCCVWLASAAAPAQSVPVVCPIFTFFDAQ